MDRLPVLLPQMALSNRGARFPPRRHTKCRLRQLAQSDQCMLSHGPRQTPRGTCRAWGKTDDLLLRGAIRLSRAANPLHSTANLARISSRSSHEPHSIRLLRMTVSVFSTIASRPVRSAWARS